MVDWDERMTASLIRWIALLPLAAALLHGALIGLVRAQVAPRTTWIVSTSALTVSFLLSAASIFDLVGDQALPPIVDRVGPWLGGGVGARHLSADLSLRLDPLAAVCCVVVTGIALAVYLYALGRIQNGALAGDRVHRLFALLDLLVGSTLVLLLADNLLLFFFGWTGVGVASQLVSSFDYESKTAARAGATTFVVGRVGDLALLGAILLLFDGLARQGVPAIAFERVEASFRMLAGSQVEIPAALGGGAFALLELIAAGLVVAAISKCAQVPLHFWLGGASRGPASATALIHSATTVVAGCYVLIRCSFLLEAAPGAASGLASMGGLTIVLSSLAAANQLDLLRLAAASTSTALGFVCVGIGLGAPATATFLLLSHAFAKAHWILVLGVVQSERRGESDLRALGGLAHSLRWTHAMAVVGLLALVGVPPFGVFFAQEELLAWVESEGHPALFVACLAGLIALAYALARAHLLVFFGPRSTPEETDAAVPAPRDPTGPIQVALMLLAIFSISAGALSPSEFWGSVFGVEGMRDTVGRFLVRSVAGDADPPLLGALRWRTIAACVFCTSIGLAAAYHRHARAGVRVESDRPLVARTTRALRETLYIERAVDRALVRPLRAGSRWLLAGVVEARLLDRVVVSGGAGTARRLVWSGLRHLQNGRIQSYTMLSLMALLLCVVWLIG